MGGRGGKAGEKGRWVFEVASFDCFSLWPCPSGREETGGSRTGRLLQVTGPEVRWEEVMAIALREDLGGRRGGWGGGGWGGWGGGGWGEGGWGGWGGRSLSGGTDEGFLRWIGTVGLWAERRRWCLMHMYVYIVHVHVYMYMNSIHVHVQ